jgi:hypothetical protein
MAVLRAMPIRLQPIFSSQKRLIVRAAFSVACHRSPESRSIDDPLGLILQIAKRHSEPPAI